MTNAPRAWEVVFRHVESQLISGRLGPGDHVPPERALAAELRVGRSSVREAVRVLEVLGLLRTQTGSGPQAGAIIIATPSGGMAALMRLHVAAQGFAVDDVVKTRLLLETAIAVELAERAESRPELDPARQLLDAMGSLDLTPQEFLAMDARFHISLAEATGNQVVATMMAGLRNSIESYVLAGLPAIADWPAESRQLRAEHRSILEAIASCDADSAQSQIRKHITGYYTLTRLTEQSGSIKPSNQSRKEPG